MEHQSSDIPSLRPIHSNRIGLTSGIDESNFEIRSSHARTRERESGNENPSAGVLKISNDDFDFDEWNAVLQRDEGVASGFPLQEQDWGLGTPIEFGHYNHGYIFFGFKLGKLLHAI